MDDMTPIWLLAIVAVISIIIWIIVEVRSAPLRGGEYSHLDAYDGLTSEERWHETPKNRLEN